MMNVKQVTALFERKVSLQVREELIDELLLIAKNKAVETPVRDKFGKIARDEQGVALTEVARPNSVTNQIAAIKMVFDYSIGKPGSAEPEEGEKTQSSVVVILPTNNR